MTTTWPSWHPRSADNTSTAAVLAASSTNLDPESVSPPSSTGMSHADTSIGVSPPSPMSGVTSAESQPIPITTPSFFGFSGTATQHLPVSPTAPAPALVTAASPGPNKLQAPRRTPSMPIATSRDGGRARTSHSPPQGYSPHSAYSPHSPHSLRSRQHQVHAYPHSPHRTNHTARATTQSQPQHHHHQSRPISTSPRSPLLAPLLSASSALSASPTAPLLFDRKWSLSAGPPPDPKPPPVLPTEVVRRIIRAALELDTSLPEGLDGPTFETDIEIERRSSAAGALGSGSSITPFSATITPLNGNGHARDADSGSALSLRSGPAHNTGSRVADRTGYPYGRNSDHLPSSLEEWAPDPSWDTFGGRSARRAHAQRVAKRETVARTARSLMLVCRAWKPIVTKYLYAEPNVHGDNVAGLAHALVLGDRKWSDINLHPHSTPGRWITVLDLSHLGPTGSYLGADAATIARACRALLELTPAVTHMRLPPSGVPLNDLRVAPCIRKLRALEGVHVNCPEAEYDVVKLLRATRSLELLGIVWVGSHRRQNFLDDEDDEEPEPEAEEDLSSLPPPLDLPHLHTITLVGGPPGVLLATLTRSKLPRLTRMVMSPYEPGLITFEDSPLRGGRRAFQYAHGSKTVSLTYVSTPDWPRRDLLPAADTLSLHPNLLHLNLALPQALLAENFFLAPAFARPDHPLTAVTLPRWPRVQQTSVSPHVPAQAEQDDDFPHPPAPGGNAFLGTLLSRKSKIHTITVDGFTWVAPTLGRWAAEAGDSGMMRSWSVWMGRFGVTLRDMDGALPPVLERGRLGSNGSASGMGSAFASGGVSGGSWSASRSWVRGSTSSLDVQSALRGGGRRQSGGIGRRATDGTSNVAVMAAAAIARRGNAGAAGGASAEARVWRAARLAEESDG